MHTKKVRVSSFFLTFSTDHLQTFWLLNFLHCFHTSWEGPRSPPLWRMIKQMMESHQNRKPALGCITLFLGSTARTCLCFWWLKMLLGRNKVVLSDGPEGRELYLYYIWSFLLRWKSANGISNSEEIGQKQAQTVGSSFTSGSCLSLQHPGDLKPPEGSQESNWLPYLAVGRWLPWKGFLLQKPKCLSSQANWILGCMEVWHFGILSSSFLTQYHGTF